MPIRRIKIDRLPFSHIQNNTMNTKLKLNQAIISLLLKEETPKSLITPLREMSQCLVGGTPQDMCRLHSVWLNAPSACSLPSLLNDGIGEIWSLLAEENSRSIEGVLGALNDLGHRGLDLLHIDEEKLLAWPNEEAICLLLEVDDLPKEMIEPLNRLLACNTYALEADELRVWRENDKELAFPKATAIKWMALMEKIEKLTCPWGDEVDDHKSFVSWQAGEISSEAMLDEDLRELISDMPDPTACPRGCYGWISVTTADAEARLED